MVWLGRCIPTPQITVKQQVKFDVKILRAVESALHRQSVFPLSVLLLNHVKWDDVALYVQLATICMKNNTMAVTTVMVDETRKNL